MRKGIFSNAILPVTSPTIMTFLNIGSSLTGTLGLQLLSLYGSGGGSVCPVVQRVEPTQGGRSAPKVDSWSQLYLIPHRIFLWEKELVKHKDLDHHSPS